MAEPKPVTENERKDSTASAISRIKSILKRSNHVRQESIGSTEEAETVATTTQRSRRKRVKAHLKKWWWLYIVSFAILVAGIVGLIMGIYVPWAIRRQVASNELPILAGTIEPISNTHVRMGITTQTTGPSAFSVRLDGFNMSLSNIMADDDWELPDLDKSTELHPVFATLQVPAHTVSGTGNLTIADQIVEVQNATEFSTFMTRAFNGVGEKGGSLRVKGTTTAYLGKIKTKVTFKNKAVFFQGMNKLEGTAVTSTEAVIPFADDGSNVKGALNLVNSSPFTLSLGNMTCSVFGMMGPGLLDGYMGSTIVDDLVIRPGNQSLDYHGTLDVDVLSENSIALMMDKSVKETGLVQIAFRGNNTVVNGEQIHYLDEVLSKIDVTADVPMSVGTKIAWEALSHFNSDF